MADCVVRIERLANGYEVEVTDPAIAAANRKRDSLPYDSKVARPPYKNPKMSYGFKTTAEVMSFLEKNLDKALPMDDYSCSFNEAVSAGDD